MALTTFCEIVFKSDGDYKSYNEMIRGALNDDCYQKIYPGIASEVLLDNLLKFVQDVNNRPTGDGVDHGTLYKKANGRQIDSSRRYYLVKEPNLDEFNLYVKVTKGRNLGHYRIHTNEDEVEILIQYGLNYLKQQGALPIVADYVQFAQVSKYFIARERCEFISRLLNNNVAATRNAFKSNYDVKTLGSKEYQQRQRRKAKIVGVSVSSLPSTSSSPPHAQKQVLPASAINKRTVRSPSLSPEREQSASSEHEESSSPEREQSQLAKKKTNNKLIKGQQQQQTSKAVPKKAAATASSHETYCPINADTTATKTSAGGKRTKTDNSRSAVITYSTPIVNRLRAKSNGRIAVGSSSLSASSSHMVLTTSEPKNKPTNNVKKRRHPSEDEENHEPTSGSAVPTMSADAKSVKGRNGGARNKRMKK